MAKATNKIYLEKGGVLSDATSFVFDPSDNCAASSASKHVYFKQHREDYASVLGHAQDNTWIYREFPCQGILDTEFILDAGDVIERVAKVDAWKNSAICMQSTKNNKVKFSSLVKIESNNTVKVDSNILISTYHGDMGDFIHPPSVEWKHLCAISDGWMYRNIARSLIKFSALKTAVKDKSIWLRFDGQLLTIVSGEKGDRTIGQSLIRLQVECISPEISFGICGRYLAHTSEVIENEGRSIVIEVDNLENPNYVKFSGNTGWVILKTRERVDNRCGSLPDLESRIFRGEDIDLETFGYRTFLLQQLKAGISKQAPKKGSDSSNIILDLQEDELFISKRDDIAKEESSIVPLWTTSYEGGWETLTLLQGNISEMLDILDSYLTSAMKNLNDADPTSLYKTVNLTIKRNYAKKRQKYCWRFFINHPSYPQLSFSQEAITIQT